MNHKSSGFEDYWRILTRIWGILIRRKWSFLITLFLITFFAGGLAYVLPDVYSSTTMIFVEPQKVPEDYVKPTITTEVQERLKTITQQILSRTRLEKIIKEFGLYQGTGQKCKFESVLAHVPFLAPYCNFDPLDTDAAVTKMREDIDVEVKGDKVFTITYQGSDPETVMQVTNKIASLFIEENLKVREQQVEGTSEFLETELRNIRLVLEQHEQRIRDFKQQYMGELPEQLDANLKALDRFQMELKSTDEALKGAIDRKEALEKLLATADPDDPVTGVGGNTLITRLEQLKAELTRLRSEYKEGYPDIALIQKEIQEIEASLARGEGSTEHEKEKGTTGVRRNPFIKNLLAQLSERNLEIKSLKDRREELTRQIRIYEKRVENTPAREQQLMTIMRDYENIQKNYQSLLDKRLQARISENLEKRQQGEIFRILDPANYPTVPYSPNRLMIVLIGMVIGSASGIGLVLLRDQVDQSFKTEEELWEALGIPVLASIPHRPALRRVIKKPLKTDSGPGGAYKPAPKAGQR